VGRAGGKEDKYWRWILFGGVDTNGTDGAGNDEGDSDGRGGEEEDNDGIDKSLEDIGEAAAARGGGDAWPLEVEGGDFLWAPGAGRRCCHDSSAGFCGGVNPEVV